MMKISVWSDYLSGLTTEEKVKTFTACGYNYSELSSEDGYELLERGNPEKTGRELRSFAENYGFSFEQGHLDLYADILDGFAVEALKPWLDLFHTVGIKASVLHYGKSSDMNTPPAELLERRAEPIRQIADYVKGTGMFICIENSDMKNDKSCDNILSIIKAAGSSNLGICLDTGHLNLAGGNPVTFAEQAGSYLKALHIADNEGAYDQHLMPYGRGTVPWEQFMSFLNSSSYDGLFNFEIPGESTAPAEIREAKLRYLKEMAVYMSRIR